MCVFIETGSILSNEGLGNMLRLVISVPTPT